ncbi:ligand-binding sensor domain-containing protein [Planctobacterium marinum]|uniref:histidine kinase n=1 Tax=Planctobacterium marinum TaxID=1631968 RepID=A0AA48HP77_9ALTE|nr:hybrid sensor histidine kinase/response regulator [Planctobacterium marinum]
MIDFSFQVTSALPIFNRRFFCKFQVFMLFLLSTLPCSIHASTEAVFTSIERLSVAEGLPAASVYSLMTDQKGFLWLGTPKGLVRYDGARFNTFSAESSSDFTIASTDSSNAFIDSEGRFWLGSWGKGIALYDRNMQALAMFKSNDSSNTIGSDKIQTIFEDSQGRIWIGSYSGGLALYNEEKQNFRSFKHQSDNPQSISHDRVWSITEDAEGYIWAGTSDGLNKLIDLEKGDFQRFFHDPEQADSLNNSLIRKLYTDRRGRMWVGTEIGFGEFNTETSQFTSFEPADKPIHAGITALQEDANGDIWVGAQKGLYLFSAKEQRFLPLTSLGNFAILSQDDLRAIRFDNNGVLWVATRYGGLAKIQFKPSLFRATTQYINRQGVASNLPRVLSLYIDSTQRTWVGAQDGLYLQNSKGGTPTPFQPANMQDITGVWDITENRDGRLWLATEDGLFNIAKNRKEIERYHGLPNLNSPGVSQVYFDNEGAMWLALKLEGVVKIHNGNIIHFRHNPDDPTSLSYDAATKIFQDRQERIWIGTNGGGLNQYVPFKERFIRYENRGQNDSELSNNNINDIYQTRDNQIWIATEAGLNRLDEQSSSFIHYDTEDGLTNGNIRAMVEDHNGNIWLSSDFGLHEFRRKEEYFVNYSHSSDLHSLEFSSSSSVAVDKAHFIFGGRGGYTSVDLTQISAKQTPPQIHITQLWIDRKPQKAQLPGENDILNLPATTKEIRIDFATLDLVTPSNNRYQYRLLGLDDDWSAPVFEPSVRYTGLRPGEYQFQVKGANSVGVWSLKPATVTITLVPPIWQRHWFQILIIVTIFSLILLGVKLRTRALKRERAQLEELVRQRSDELIAAQKQIIESEKHNALSSLVAGVAHEINTPLGISITAASTLQDNSTGLAMLLLEGKISKAELRQHIEQISESASLIQNNLEKAGQLVRSFKEVAVDQVSDQRRKFELHAYIEEIILSIKAQLKAKNIELQFTCPNELWLDNYPGTIAQILTNLLMNALIHAFEERLDGRIEILVTEQADKLRIEVRDNGCGIEEDKLKRIFDPFYTTARNKGSKGLGLHVIQNLIDVRLKGHIYCESKYGRGTCFVLAFKRNPD